MKNFWYSERSWLRVFTPLSWIVSSLVETRRSLYKTGIYTTWHAPIPVCVVGNILVGGTGKTPLVIWLTEWLIRRGIRVGIVSRGYGGSAPHYPLAVNGQSSCLEVGEENILVYRRTQVPVVVDPNRVRATQYLLEHNSIDLVISDDGLQHHRLGRNIEVAVLDGLRGFGNGLLLPFGPMRESKKRLNSVHWIVSKSEHKVPNLRASVMDLKPLEFVNLASNTVLSTNQFRTKYLGQVRAVAAIGNPESFQNTLDRLQLEVQVEPYRDHHYFRAEEIAGGSSHIIVTEKDAQKIRELPVDLHHVWYLKVEVQFNEEIDDSLASLFEQRGLPLKNTK